MNGVVDGAGRALIVVEIGGSNLTPRTPIQAWIDTGFTGELVLPQKTIEDLGLVNSGTVGAVLADGTQIALRVYSCIVNWFGEQRKLEVVATSGDHPLLGVGLLLDRDLRIDYRSRTITIQ